MSSCILRPSLTFLTLLSAAFLSLSAAPSRGTGLGAFLVNESVEGTQVMSNLWVDPATGSSVVVWTSWPDEGTSTIYGRRFDGQANPLGGEFVVRFDAALEPYTPTVSGNAAGGFVVVWAETLLEAEERGSTSVEQRIVFRRYDAAGVALGDPVEVSAGLFGDQKRPDVAVAGDGDFLIAWVGEEASGSGAMVPLGSFVDAAGAVTSAAFELSSSPANNAQHVVVEADQAGEFFAVWEDGDGLQGRRMNENGVPVGAAAVLLEPSFEIEGFDFALRPDGSGVLTWSSYGIDGSLQGIACQSFDASGQIFGDLNVMNLFTEDTQVSPSIVQLPSGRFLVAWRSVGDEPSARGLFARELDSAGLPDGPQTLVFASPSRSVVAPKLGLGAHGEVTAIWIGTDFFEGDDILGRRLPFFTDGLESGDTTGWSITLP